MRLTKIYTKVGDRGTTMLASGELVSKDAIRIHAYGTVDELNSVIGMLRDQLVMISGESKKDDLIKMLYQVQNELFDVGGELATPLKILDPLRQKVVSPAEVSRLEVEIDAMNQHLPPLENFVLPGGHIANSTAHLARTVCRRAERHVVELAESEDVRPDVKIYLNRLSDWLFVLCREISFRQGIKEVIWDQRSQ